MSKRKNEQESVWGLPMAEQDRAAWSKKLKPARVAKGLTQRDVSEMSGVSLKTIGNIESGRMIPQAANLKRLMMALDLGPNPADGWPDWVHTWIAVVAPLIQQVPEESRGDLMLKIVMMIGEAITDRKTYRFSTGDTRAEVEARQKEAFAALGITDNESVDNVHQLTPRNQSSPVDRADDQPELSEQPDTHMQRVADFQEEPIEADQDDSNYE
ncbi:helix-turn-helix domain-containing protein [Rhodococcus globerulus]|uniref:helix-turn-helix domain-containing protein n=1 Tax=Rhodococcus globerulus TaxID=33008 RepID=UPI0039E9A005